jgi:hypothetical protein
MVQYEYWEDVGLHFLVAREPFQLNELYELGKRSLQLGGRASELWRPTLLDLRRVNLTQINEAEFRRMIIKRKAFGSRYDNNPMAYLVSDIGSFGKIRLNNIFAELTMLRSEDQTTITTEVKEIVEWLIPRLPKEGTDSKTLLRRIG